MSFRCEAVDLHHGAEPSPAHRQRGERLGGNGKTRRDHTRQELARKLQRAGHA